MKLPGLEGGGGDYSYANNSKLQNHMFHAYVTPHLSQALDHVFSAIFRSSSTSDTADERCQCCVLRVADLGCSHGPNTLEYAHFIAQGMQKSLQSMILHTQSVAFTLPSPDGQHASTIPSQTAHFELQYLFSDLPGNDFNSLFRSLLPLGPQLQNALHVVDNEINTNNTDSGALCTRPFPQMSIFAAGVPGSFYGRLFPKESLHMAVSAFSFHWLSQVPPSVVDKACPAWNDGYVWIQGSRPKVVEAYAQQFQEDAKAFFECRAQELVRGGILFIFAITRSQEHPSGCYFDTNCGNDLSDFWMGDFQSSWQEMVNEGLVSEEEIDMFNVPMYNFHRRELEAALGGLEGELEVIKVEVLKDCDLFPNEVIKQFERNPEAFGKAWAGILGSLMKPLVEGLLGENRTEELFRRFESLATKRMHSLGFPTSPPCIDTIVATIRRR